MFERDFTLVGKHATYMKYLVNDAKLYKRNIDVYMNAAVFGLLYSRTADKDPMHDDTDIPASVFQRERKNCVLLYRLVMLLDEMSGLTPEERVDRAFRDDADDAVPEKLEANMELFNAYVRGGIEVMYEQFIDGGGTSADEYLERAMDVMQDFKEELDGFDPGDKLQSLIQG